MEHGTATKETYCHISYPHNNSQMALQKGYNPNQICFFTGMLVAVLCFSSTLRNESRGRHSSIAVNSAHISEINSQDINISFKRFANGNKLQYSVFVNVAYL